MHVIELVIIAVIGGLTIFTQFQTTQMQIQNHAKDVVEAEAKSAVQRELDVRVKSSPATKDATK